MVASQIKNLFIRMDKIGDLVLSLNADQWAPLANEISHWWIAKGLETIPQAADPPRAATAFSKNFSWTEFLRAWRWLKESKPQRAFVFHAPWWVGLALLLAGVPERYGRKSQWHSFLFFNRGIRQKRSLSDHHESDYNIAIMQNSLDSKFSALAPSLPPPLRLKAAPQNPDPLPKFLLRDKDYVVVHPGMAGSALNWPVEHYENLIQKLMSTTTVAVTGTALDRTIIEQLKLQLPPSDKLAWLDEQLNLHELLYILSHARAVVAPSTGVIHLAASLGTPVIGLYSPRRVEHPRRWGPRGPSTQVFVPAGIDRDANVDSSVMKTIQVDDVYAGVRSLL